MGHSDNGNPDSIWGLIPSRLGSRRLPGKATRLLCGKPLISYTFEAARDAFTLQRTFLFSDDPAAIELAGDYGVEIPPFPRPASVSDDAATSEETIRCFLNGFTPQELPEAVVVLQPTSPMRSHSDIDVAVRLFQSNPCDCLMSVNKTLKPLKWTYQRDAENYLAPAFENADTDLVFPNGAIYIFRPQTLLQGGKLTSGRMLAYEMPWQNSVDIDTEEELLWAEALMRRQAARLAP